jgi:protein involved in plasmid replication-relaxation
MAEACTPPARVRARHISWVAEHLSDRDRAILASVHRLRLASAHQLERLHFAELSEPSRARTRRRVLARLSDWRVLAPLERRIGGIRAGSTGLVFAVDSAGQWLLQHDAYTHGATVAIRRPSRPSPALLHHTLAVSELFTALVELSRVEPFAVRDFWTEPRAWLPDGLGGWLKPDAYAVLATDAFVDEWCIEQDNATEHLPTIARKLRTYLDFFVRGQRGPNGIMPRVLLSVPTDARRAAVQGVIRRLPDPAPQLFHVVTHEHTARYLVRVLRE